MRLTSDFLIPLPMPRAATSSSTERVEIPPTSASMTTAYSAWSMRPAGSRMEGKKLPFLSLGWRARRRRPWWTPRGPGARCARWQAGLASFVALRPDQGARLGLDQLLEDVAHGAADQIHAIGRFECLQQLSADRLVKGHQGAFLGAFGQEHTQNHPGGTT